MLGPLMIDLAATSLSAEERELLLHPAIGGVIFFARNYQNPEQLKQLVDAIRTVRESLIIAVDQEGGRVQRFKHGFTILPPLAVLYEGCQDNPQQAEARAEEHAFTMASELINFGIDISFAPVLDLRTINQTAIGDRSFSPDPLIVAKLARAYIRGMRKAGMAATGKHFPGHGGVVADSHHALPVDERDWDTISNNDLLPFKLLATDLAAIMTAHIRYPAIDNKPSSFSSFWLQQILRKQLNFQGVIFSDDLSMAGASYAGTVVERTQLALTAGCDMVLICNCRAGVYDVLANLKLAANSDSQTRLVALKANLQLRNSCISETIR